MGIEWKPINSNTYQGVSRSTSEKVNTATRVDLAFGSNSQLRAISEVYACSDLMKSLLMIYCCME